MRLALRITLKSRMRMLVLGSAFDFFRAQVGPVIALHLRIESDLKYHCKFHKKHPGCFRDAHQIADMACNELRLPCKDATAYIMTGAAPQFYAHLAEKFAKVVDKSLLTNEVR